MPSDAFDVADDAITDVEATRPPRQRDPQVVVTGKLKQTQKAEVIVFTLPLSLIDLVCIVTIPAEGTDVVPVYVKFKVRRA